MEPKHPKSTIDEGIDKIALAMINQGIPEDMMLSLVERKIAKEEGESPDFEG